jgi:hypothetical protein
MRRAPAQVLLLLALATATFGQARQSKTGSDGFEADFPSGGLLRMHIRSGDVRIFGGEPDKIIIHYEGKNSDRASEVKVSFKKSGQTGDLSIEGGPQNDFQVILQVPRKSNLYVRMPFGALDIAAVSGDKDVEVHAGDVTLALGKADDYGHVDASVTSGELSADPFHVDKGGLFRSFKAQGRGNYRLHAHLGAGNLTLQN